VRESVRGASTSGPESGSEATWDASDASGVVPLLTGTASSEASRRRTAVKGLSNTSSAGVESLLRLIQAWASTCAGKETSYNR
jgi:hypothetical protein